MKRKTAVHHSAAKPQPTRIPKLRAAAVTSPKAKTPVSRSKNFRLRVVHP